MKINRDINDFTKEGYVVLDFYNTDYLSKFKERVINSLREILNSDDVTLETFHNYVKTKEEKIDIQYRLNKMIWDEQLHLKIIADNIKHYHDLIGKDLDIQVNPYLRIARPNCPEDNIGFHRDSFYGNSAYEISSFIPLVELNEKNTLMIEPKSHKKGPIPYVKIKDKEVTKGSIQSQLGFLYEPKIIDENYKIEKLPVPVKFGQSMIFGLGTIHGQEVNSSDTTRWSMDIRVKNTFAPTNTKEGYYKNLSLSPVAQCAKLYYQNNKDEL